MEIKEHKQEKQDITQDTAAKLKTEDIKQTCIALSVKTKEILHNMKIHPREPYGDVVDRLVNERTN